MAGSSAEKDPMYVNRRVELTASFLALTSMNYSPQTIGEVMDNVVATGYAPALLAGQAQRDAYHIAKQFRSLNEAI